MTITQFLETNRTLKIRTNQTGHQFAINEKVQTMKNKNLRLYFYVISFPARVLRFSVLA